MKLERYSFGIGDRFARQGKSLLQAFQLAKGLGIDVVPVWNKSHREHTIVGTKPESVRAEADEAVRELGWKSSYYVDADHINAKNVDLFMTACDFFTIDVADFIGKPAPADEVKRFVDKYSKYATRLNMPRLNTAIEISRSQLTTTAANYLAAIREAAAIYKRIENAKGKGNFMTEISMDECSEPQSPADLFIILAAIADAGIPAQTIAPKFPGEFHKGVDYVGDVRRFESEFRADLAVIEYARNEFGLSENLKPSVHSGSDKFSIYGPIGKAIREFDSGIHIKTAGTTWLEEIAALAAAGGEGLKFANEVYSSAYSRIDEMIAPYRAVTSIRPESLPSPAVVRSWSAEDFASALRHEPENPKFNSGFRQFLHVAYKVAAEMGTRYTALLEEHHATVGACVTDNIYRRHIKRIFA